MPPPFLLDGEEIQPGMREQGLWTAESEEVLVESK